MKTKEFELLVSRDISHRIYDLDKMYPTFLTILDEKDEDDLDKRFKIRSETIPNTVKNPDLYFYWEWDGEKFSMIYEWIETI